MIGQTISHYKILEKLGEGGMGIVYKAEDTKLHRPVAIKFLPKKLSVHGEERERFLHEAQAASSLNHPNICVIHEIDEVDEETFLVMEYIAGITLREWIRKKAEQTEGYRKLGVKEAVALATQIAEGLEKAHERGIIHRDIKSENIMATGDGQAKIMDFGLAKLRGVSRLTKTGSTVGTIAYMSPEQVEGTETDHRTDIFSFGVVLYEMLAGKLPFQAEHEAALMYEIINVDPPSLLELRKGVEHELNRIAMKCLEKNRDERYQSMREVAVDLKRYKRDSEGKRIERKFVTGEIGQPEPFIKKSRTSMVVAGGIIVLLLVAGVLYFSRQTATHEVMNPDMKITKATSGLGLEDEPSWSPDGKFLAYTSDDRRNYDILILPLGGGQPIRVVDSDADDVQPSWSPDGAKLAFVSARDHGGRLSMILAAGPIEPYLSGGKGGDIFLVPAFGGTPVKLVENGFDPAWSPDGKTIVFRSIHGTQWDLWTIPVEGGVTRQLTNDQHIDYQPDWSPDGKWIVYGSHFEVCLIPSTGGKPVFLTSDGSVVIQPAWSPDGNSILFSSKRGGSMNIWKIPFSPDGRSSEAPTRVTIGEGDDVSIRAAAAGSKIAFATVKSARDIWELQVASNTLRQVSSATSGEENPHLSPDGKTLLVQSDRSGKFEVWTMDLNGNFLSQLTSSRYGDLGARWSSDGKRIVYEQLDSTGKLFVRSLGDVSAMEVADSAFEASWSPDGNYLAYGKFTDGRSDVWVHSLTTGESKQLVALEASSELPSWSPDGKWIAFNTLQYNSRQVWIVPSTGGTPKQIISGESEYSHPQWSPRDKDVLVCLKDHKNICLISVSTGKIKQLTKFTDSNVKLDYPTWSFDGQRIYFSLAKKEGDIYTLENY